MNSNNDLQRMSYEQRKVISNENWHAIDKRMSTLEYKVAKKCLVQKANYAAHLFLLF